MSWFTYLLLASMLATHGTTTPVAKSVLDDVYRVEKKLTDAMSLSAKIMYQKVLSFESEHASDDSKIPDLAKSLGLTKLVDILSKTGLISTLSQPGPFTVFGPTNKAFTDLPHWAEDILSNKTLLTSVLKFHVLPTSFPSTSLQDELLVSTALKDKKLRVNIYTDAVSDAVNVITAQCAPVDLLRVDKKASNGLIHVLNSVMIPPAGNIVDSIIACPVFTTLVKAVEAARLVQTLSSDGPFTLFAPTDKAFKKLPPGFLDYLLKNTTALYQVLEYHVVSLTYCGAGLATGLYGQITTLAGVNITVQASQGGLKVNEANIIVPDGSVSNGVVHAIDTVLIPPHLN